MKSDAEEILREIEDVINQQRWGSPDDLLYAIDEYLRIKRLEFVEPQGDCV